jgi:hypothetical protein
VFIGRGAELALLEGAVAEGGRLVLLSGEPGIGKTRLAEELARRTTASVAWGRTWEGEGTPAFWPWIQILRHLGIEAPLAGEVAPADPAAEKFRRFDAVLGALVTAARARPLLLVLDDMHAADAASVELLAFVARGLRGASVSVIATARDSAPERLAPIAREALAVPLGRLAEADVTHWISAVQPALAHRADELFAVSEGNPLFVAELLVAARKRPDAAWSGTRLPSAIREALRAHLAMVGARAALEASAIAGRDFDARDDLDDAIRAGVIVDLGDKRMRFAHALLREEVLTAIEPARRGELHRAAAVDARDPAIAAHHWLLGARPQDTDLALSAVRAAMRDAELRLAFEDAAALGERALGVLQLEVEDACELEIAMGEATILAGRVESGRAVCLRVAERASGFPPLLARAALAAAGDITFGRSPEIIDVLERALASLARTDSALRARVMARLALALVPVPLAGIVEQARLRDEAVAMARRVGDEVALLDCVRYAISVAPERMAPRERFALRAEALALAERGGRLVRVIPLLSSHVADWFELGDPDGAARQATYAREQLVALAQPHHRWRVPLLDAMLAALDGRFAEATAANQEALAGAEAAGVRDGMMHACLQRMSFPYVRGAADGDAEAIVALCERLVGWTEQARVYRAVWLAPLGRVDAVRGALEVARALPPGVLPGTGVASVGWPCVLVGALEHAGWLYDAIAATDHVPLVLGPAGLSCYGPMALLLGRLAALLGRSDAAAAHYAVALAMAERLRWRPYVAQTELAWADLGGDGAGEHAARALEIARAIGMHAVAARAEAIAKPPPAIASGTPELVLTRDGATWTIAAGARRVTLRDGKGVAYLAALVAQPHREIYVLELIGGGEDSDAGPLIDERARRAYRDRAESLREELEDATARNDLARAERLRAEFDALAGELARAVGLGGRSRRAGSLVERARVNVQRRLRAVIEAVAGHDAHLARHLELSVRTGIFCMYAPTWP